MSGVGLFRGLLVEQRAAHDVVAPAYDALSVEERQRFRREKPDSYLHVTRSAADEPDAMTVDNRSLAGRGRASLDRLLDKGVFRPSRPPALYVYRLAEGTHVQLGLVCEVACEHFEAHSKPHEATQFARAQLLAEHFTHVRAASSPIACAVRDAGQLEAALQAAARSTPELDLIGDDGLRQTVWRVDDPATEARLLRLVGDADLYIIDGHHRAAAIQQLHDDGVASLPVLAAIFPEKSLHLVGFHRLVKLSSELGSAELLAACRKRFRVEPVDNVLAVEQGRAAMYLQNQWYIVHFDEVPIGGNALIRLGSLDPVVLEREIINGIIAARCGSVDVTFAPDIDSFDRIMRQAVDEHRVPFFVAPVAMADLIEVARGGLILPAKSTYFTPKVRAGIFLRVYDEFGSGGDEAAHA